MIQSCETVGWNRKIILPVNMQSRFSNTFLICLAFYLKEYMRGTACVIILQAYWWVWYINVKSFNLCSLGDRAISNLAL